MVTMTILGMVTILPHVGAASHHKKKKKHGLKIKNTENCINNYLRHTCLFLHFLVGGGGLSASIITRGIQT